jgi:hypothetical protein
MVQPGRNTITTTYRLGLALSALALAPLSGCTFARDQIVFRHPVTHDEQVCLRPPAIAIGPADISERNRYSDCKTTWEDRGYVRITQDTQ